VAVLDGPARELVSALALFEDPPELSLLQEIVALDGADVGRAVAGATASGLVQRRGNRLCFVHRLARRAVADSVPPAVVAGLHEVVAEALMRRAGPEGRDAAAIAHHLQRAGGRRRQDAIDWARRAASQVAAELDFDAAASWLSTAVDLAEAAGGSAPAELLVELGSALLRGSGARRAAAVLEEATIRARVTGEPALEARGASELAEAVHRAPGGVDAGQVTLVLGRALFAVGDGSEWAPRLSLGLVRHAMTGRDLAHADSLTRGWPADIQADEVELDLAGTQRWALAGPSPLECKHEASRRLLHAADAADDPAARWQARCWALIDALEAHDRAAAVSELGLCRLAASASGQPFLRFGTDVAEAALALLDGRYDAVEVVHEGLVEALAVAELDPTALWAQRAVLLRDLGRLEELVEMISRTDDMSRVQDVTARAVRALVWAESDDHGRAAEELDRLLAEALGSLHRDSLWLNTVALAGAAAVAAAHREVAAAALDALTPLRDRGVVAGVGPHIYFGAVAHHTGCLALLLGDARRAVADLRTAQQLHGALGARPWLARSLTELGAALRERSDPGDDAQATRCLAEARRLSVALGMPLVHARCERLDAAGSKPAGPVMRPEGELWAVGGVAAPVFRVPASKGLMCLRHLVERPGEAIAAQDLVEAAIGEEAPDAERARVNVTRQLRSAIQVIERHDPQLADHLARSIRTGRLCAYLPVSGDLVWRT